MSHTFWKYENTEEVDSLHRADTCMLSRGTYLSSCSLAFYGLVIFYLGLVRMFPAYTHESMQNGFDYDDVTVPSFLGSIGKSVTSKLSRGSGAHSSLSSVSNESKGQRSRGSNTISNIMEPIIEGDDDDKDDDFVNSIVGGNSTKTGSTKYSKNSSKSGGSTRTRRSYEY